jgi:hypothetical protein
LRSTRYDASALTGARCFREAGNRQQNTEGRMPNTVIAAWLSGVILAVISMFFIVWSLDAAIRTKNKRVLYFTVASIIALILIIMTIRGEL